MATYSITVYNDSPTQKSFCLFCELPQLSPNPQEGNPFANAFAVGRPAANDNEPTTFTVTTTAYACCGYKQITNNTIVDDEDNVQVTLDGSQGSVANMQIVDGGPSFTSSGMGATAGTFQIQVPAYEQTQYPNVWCGYGYPAPDTDNALPSAIRSRGHGGPDYSPGIQVAACWVADSYVDFIVQPIVKFYVAFGTYQPGQAVNLTEIGTTADIDFTNQGDNFYASVTLGSENTFGPVTYSATPDAIIKKKSHTTKN